MLKRIEPFTFNDGQKEDLELAEWAWNSHNWLEYSPGYYECVYCSSRHTSVMGINRNYPLCKENPLLKGKI